MDQFCSTIVRFNNYYCILPQFTLGLFIYPFRPISIREVRIPICSIYLQAGVFSGRKPLQLFLFHRFYQPVTFLLWREFGFWSRSVERVSDAVYKSEDTFRCCLCANVKLASAVLAFVGICSVPFSDHDHWS